MELETRDFEVREVSKEDKTVTGIAVPWNTPTTVSGYTEQFERGAIESVEGTKLFWNHTEVIGKVIRGAETDDGYEITARFSDTTHGRDAHVLAMDGVVDKFSVGFLPVEQREEDGVLTRTKVNLKEVSLVPFPAYQGAQVSEVRASESKNTNQTEGDSKESQIMDITKIENEIAELRGSNEDLVRELAIVKENGGNATPAAELLNYRSFGEFVKGLADGSSREDVEKVNRAFTGATTADNAGTAPAWVNRQVKLVEENRNIFNLFNKAPLPRAMSFSYPVFGSKTGDVAKQATEGADLPYLELVTATAQASPSTYGGYSSLSRQVIELSDPAYLQRVLDMQSISYAKVTNGIIRTSLTGASGVNTNTGLAAGNTTAAGWLNAAIDGVSQIANNSVGLSADVWVMSTAAFAKLAAVVDSAGRPVFVINGDGQNTIGNVNVKGLSASVAGIPVVVDPALTGTFSYIASTEALTVYEAAGAPFRLQDENIINLTKDFSLYGYLASTLDDAKGIVKVTTTV